MHGYYSVPKKVNKSSSLNPILSTVDVVVSGNQEIKTKKAEKMHLQTPIFFLALVCFIASCNGRSLGKYAAAVSAHVSGDYSSSSSLVLDNNGGILSIVSAKIMTVNVDSYGTQGNGIDDDTLAFEKAWKVVCSYRGEEAVLVVPKKKYMVMPISFSGPCSSALTVKIYGTIEASKDRSDYKDRRWLVFDSVRNVSIEGGGTINGNGDIWWKNSCKINKSLPCKDAPTALTIHNSERVALRNLNIQDAQQMHVNIVNSRNVEASFLVIAAPGESPNTDGIHVTNSIDVQILNIAIGTGDDCISIASGSQNVRISDITCGPGHGISVGSLGEGNSKAYVSGVTVNRAKLSGTTNGVRIKTWQGGSGSASNITFQNIQMDKVKNPIIIDQFYCDQSKPCKEQKSAVKVKGVVYQNIKGTSASTAAITLDCSKSIPCEGIILQDVSLSTGSSKASALCNNVAPANVGVVSPRCL